MNEFKDHQAKINGDLISTTCLFFHLLPRHWLCSLLPSYKY